jgi:hypothetical protein
MLLWYAGAGASNVGVDLAVTAIGEVFTVGGPQGLFNGNAVGGSVTAGSAGNWTLRLGLGSYTSGLGQAGKSGYINFNLKYAPFGGKDWSGINISASGLYSGGIENSKPVWVIRSGINDGKQDGDTTFTALEWDGVKNGNGGVAFLVGVETSSVLRILDGEFETAAAIKFTVEGYGAGTTAGVYYAQVPIGDSAPAWGSGYVKLGDYGPGSYTGQAVTVGSLNDVDVYAVLVKDGVISDPYKLKKITVMIPVWPDIVYGYSTKAYYVSVGGDDGTGTGEREMDTVPVVSQIGISGGGYPKILLCDDPESPGGKLQAQSSIGVDNYLVRMETGVSVTLGGTLTLNGTGATNGHGVGVYGGALTMDGGTISHFSDGGYYGGGVHVDNGVFTMNAGTISDNSTTKYGGGVYIYTTTAPLR